jgi:ATP-dependent RNA helicase RhlE
MLVRLLKEQSMSRVIVFTRTKHGADKLHRDLDRAGIAAASIHGNKSQNQRERALAAFKSPRPPVLIATDIAARGIDVDHVSHVVNFEPPHEPETYVHRIGRTGRAGRTGEAVTLCDHDEQPRLKAIEKLLRRPIPHGNEMPAGPPASEPVQQRREARPRSETRGGQRGRRRSERRPDGRIERQTSSGSGSRPAEKVSTQPARQDGGTATLAKKPVRKHRRAL